MTDEVLFFICPICEAEDTIISKNMSREGIFCGFCTECLEVCETVGSGDTDAEAIKDFIHKNRYIPVEEY